MSEIKEEEKEGIFEFRQDFCNFEFSLGYSYTKFEEKKHLVSMDFMFWHVFSSPQQSFIIFKSSP